MMKDNPENNFLDPKKLFFFCYSTGRIGLKIGEELINNQIQPTFLFPFTQQTQFISLRDENGKEIGIIKDLNDLTKEARALLRKELIRTYLMPVVKDIIQIKEVFGNYRWKVITDRGEKEFYVKGRSENLAFINDWRIILTDMENCRYEIRDWRILPRRAKIELEKVI